MTLPVFAKRENVSAKLAARPRRLEWAFELNRFAGTHAERQAIACRNCLLACEAVAESHHEPEPGDAAGINTSVELPRPDAQKCVL